MNKKLFAYLVFLDVFLMGCIIGNANFPIFVLFFLIGFGLFFQ